MASLPLKHKPSAIFATSRISLRTDLEIILSAGVFTSPYQHDAETTAPIFELSYNRKDPIQSELNHQSIEILPDHSNLGFMKQVSGRSQYPKGKSLELLSIWMQPKQFNSFLQAVSGKESHHFDSFLQNDYRLLSFKTDPREEAILNRLSNCLKCRPDKFNLLLLESHVLELIAINLERLLDLETPPDHCPFLSRTDQEALFLARDILLSRLINPPSILELSRLIHMNDCKLKRTFKCFFGKTVYSFIREKRLEKAFHLITDRHYSVSQSAYAVGYTNISHFSTAFRKQFGVNPSVYK